MAPVTIDHLTKTYDGGEIVAVDALSFEVEDGEFIVVVGPSGCGKSTTLNCIAGLEEPTEGRIFFGDEDITEQKPQQRDIAMVFQNYALYPHMNVRKNIEFGLKMRTDLSRMDIRSRADEVAETLGISELLDQRPSSLSGGQQQRVALGRAIARDPEVFLMDEPLSNLDAKLRTTMRAELQDLQDQFDVTTVYVTHDQTEAMTMGDRIVILNEGSLQQIGTPLQCYHEPKNEFVAGFLGSPSMNFVPVEFRGRALHHPEFEYALPDETASLLGDKPDQVTLGIRPESIDVARDRDENTIRAEVRVVEPVGDAVNLFVDVGDERLIATIDDAILYEPGEVIHLTFPPDEIHIFDGATGETIVNRSKPYGTQEQSQPA